MDITPFHAPSTQVYVNHVNAVTNRANTQLLNVGMPRIVHITACFMQPSLSNVAFVDCMWSTHAIYRSSTLKDLSQALFHLPDSRDMLC